MMRLGLILMVILLAACTRGEPDVPALDATSSVPAFGIEFDHPADLEPQWENASGSAFGFGDEADLRYNRMLEFAATGQLSDGLEPTAIELDSGGTVTYVNETSTVGSGGTEHFLVGYVETDQNTFYVRANASEKAGYGDADWALPMIRTIRPLDSDGADGGE